MNSRLIPRLSFDSGKEKHCAGHRHGSASQLREVDQTSGAEYLDFACCYAGLLGVFCRYNGSLFLGIPVNVIMEQSPVAWPLPFLDSSRDDHDRCAASLLRLSTIRTDSIQVIRTGLGSIVINALFGLGSILIRSDDGADVGDLRVAVFFLLAILDFWSFGKHYR